MRKFGLYEWSIAWRYLMPHWRELPRTAITLLSVLVITLVVWLVIVFFSVAKGLERSWIEKLVAVTSPVRITPTEQYYHSYYYHADAQSEASRYTRKTISEKLASNQSDPWNPENDPPLPSSWPKPDLDKHGRLIDPVKTAFAVINSIDGAYALPYENAYANIRIKLYREEELPFEGYTQSNQSQLNQASILSSFDQHERLQKHILAPTAEDLENFIATLIYDGAFEQIEKLLSQVNIYELTTREQGSYFPPSLWPSSGYVKAVALVKDQRATHLVIPATASKSQKLARELEAAGKNTQVVDLRFERGGQFSIKGAALTLDSDCSLMLGPELSFASRALVKQDSNQPLEYYVKGKVQGLDVEGKLIPGVFKVTGAQVLDTGYKNSNYFGLYQAEKDVDNPHTLSRLPYDDHYGQGVLVAKSFKDHGVRLGDHGKLSYFTHLATSAQELQEPFYVAGFYDPGIMPTGGRMILSDPSLVSAIRGAIPDSDRDFGNGINVWVSNYEQAEEVKKEIEKAFDENHIKPYWNVQTFKEFDFAKELIWQLQSDTMLFTIVSVLIILVACSNILSMLVLLVQDKRREIAILRAMGAHSYSISLIFASCGAFIGLISCTIGTLGAFITLRYIDSIVKALSWIQGHSAFAPTFYGDRLPQEMSYEALAFVFGYTCILATISGLIPALKAARLRPAEVLKES